MTDNKLTHIDGTGRAVMVDIGNKQVTRRSALASGEVRLTAAALAQIEAGQNKKGDVLAVAELAGIMAAKRTAEIIPLCHPLPLTKLRVALTCDAAAGLVRVEAEAQTDGKTGVEMEALTAVSAACLTVYDMVKAVDKAVVIAEIKLLEKRGGKSGDWLRNQQ